jgi:phosphatidylglycerophosphate synthase
LDQNPLSVRNFIILADASASWKAAGLMQLDRLLLAVNEFAARAGDSVRVRVFWNPALDPALRVAPTRLFDHCEVNDAQAEEIRAMFQLGAAPVVVVKTSLVLGRRVLEKLIGEPQETVPIWKYMGEVTPPPQEVELWEWTAQCLSVAPDRSSDRQKYWEVLHGPEDAARAEVNLLRATSKPVDGAVSRHLNRPISQRVTRLLSRVAISPNEWTVLITTLIIPCFWLLSRGDYWGFVLGAFCYHLNSVLDGCDGELARVKYLESKTGDAVDGICDFTVNLTYVVAVGVGLWQQTGHVGYLWEGLVFGAMSMAIEGFASLSSNSPAAQIFLNAVQKIPGARFLAGPSAESSQRRSPRLERTADFLIKITKRDGYAFFFLCLAIVGQPAWTLHLVAVVLLTRIIALRAFNPAWSPENSGWRS